MHVRSVAQVRRVLEVRRNPLFRGSTVARTEENPYASISKVAIPYSEGLLLH